VEEELERRKDEIETEVLRRIDEAKRAMEAQMVAEMEAKRQAELEVQRKREVNFNRLISVILSISSSLATVGSVMAREEREFFARLKWFGVKDCSRLDT
jgi:PP-loop superfamily ATP-utilizing enzyme